MAAASGSTRTPVPSVPSDLRAIHDSFVRYSQEVVNYQIPRLHQCSSASLLTDYEAEINSSVDGLKRQVNELNFAIDEADTEEERREIVKLVNQDRKELESIRREVRKGLLSARRNIENSRTEEARAGLRLAADSAKERTGGRGGGSSGEDKLMTTSQDVTDALRRTVSLMSSELEKSAISSQLLEESTQTISSLSMQYGSLSTLMTNSANLIRTMEREDLIGKGMVAASFLFFLGCVFYILYVRVLGRGISLIAFFFRLFGLNKIFGGAHSRSVKDIKEKMNLVENVAKSGTPSVVAASLAASVSSAITSVAAAAAQASSSRSAPKAQVRENVIDLQDELEALTHTMVPHDLFEGDAATLTQTRHRPTERVEL